MFPYIDLAGLKRRSFLRPNYFDDVETETPGFTAQSIATHSSSINSRLRKRYGQLLPFGQTPPALIPSGTTPPAVALQGRPTLGSFLVVITITFPGPLGTAVFSWSSNGGITNVATGVPTAPTVLLGNTGMSAVFPAGSYDTTNVYAAAPPVPETILRWVTTLVTHDVLRRHGVNTLDPLMAGLVEEVKVVQSEIEEAANSQTGLFDLPVSEDEQSAIGTGGPLAYSEQSPYRWTELQVQSVYGHAAGVLTNPNKLVGG